MGMECNYLAACSVVTPGLDPGGHFLRKKGLFRKTMDCRVKPGNDEEGAQRCPSHRIPREHVGGALERRERGAERALELLVELFRRPAVGAVDGAHWPRV